MFSYAKFFRSFSGIFFLASTLLSATGLAGKDNERTNALNESLLEAVASSNRFLKAPAQRELAVRHKIPGEIDKVWRQLRELTKDKNPDELYEEVLRLSGAAREPVKEFARLAKEPEDFLGKTITYGVLKLECLVEPVYEFVRGHFYDVIEGKDIKGYKQDLGHVAELDNLSEEGEFMNGHLRTSVLAATIDQILLAALGDQYKSFFDVQSSPQIYRVPINPKHSHLLQGTLYYKEILPVSAVQSYGVYAWGGLRGNDFYPDYLQTKPLGQEDCCSFIQDAITTYTGKKPPSDYSTVDLRKCYLELQRPRFPRDALLDYLCNHFEVVPIFSSRGEKDLSQIRPGDVVLFRRGPDVHPDEGLGVSGHVSIDTGFWQGSPIVLEYNRDREGTGMDGFGSSVKTVDEQYAVLRPKAEVA